MHIAIVALVALLGVTLLGGRDAAVERLAGRAMAAQAMMADLEELCDRIGGRPTGSPACERAVDWAVAKFKAAGIDHVSAESYTIPNLWLPEMAEGSAITPEKFRLRMAAAPFSPGTPGTIEAAVADAGDGSNEAFARLGARAVGSIALVRTCEMKTLDDLFAEYLRNPALLEAAKKAKVAALLIQSTRPRGLLYRHPVTGSGELAPLPVAIVARESGQRLARLAAAGEARMRLTIANRTGGPYQSRNVIAEIRGSSQPDEIVLLGAHLDSWDLGTGAQDNGVNAALVIDVARGIKELGLNPRRTIRFVLFTGEEQGMWGSAEYVRRHAAELDRHKVMATFDIGSGRTTGFFLNGRAELRPRVEAALSAARSLSANNHLIDALDGTDNFDFLLSGVPSLVANQDAGPYLPDYHAESDVLEMVDAREAQMNAALASALIWGLANDPELSLRRQSRAEIDKVIKDSKLEEQMKAFGQWDGWISGKRGIPVK